MRIRIHDGQPFRVCAVVFTANGEQVQCYDALLPWPRAAQGLSSMEAHADPFADHAPCFVETVPAKIQAHLHLSRASLYRLFEPHGGVGAVILRRRLDRAMKTLLTGASSRPALRRIADELGFRSQAHFSRAFRTRFGIAPRAFQQTMRRKDHAALAAQAERVGFASLKSWLEYLSHQFPESGRES